MTVDIAAPRTAQRRLPILALLAAAGAGASMGFAPFDVPVAPIAGLALLMLAWQTAPTARAGAALGFAFGLGFFGAGVSWVYVALAGFGEMAPPLAALTTAVFVAYVAAWPALVGWLTVRFTPVRSVARLAACAALWPIFEWTRGWLFTGFPWLAVGYAQAPASPLAGFAPVGGVYLVSLACALIAAAGASVLDALSMRRPLGRAAGGPFALVVILLLAGGLLRHVDWTYPAGPPLAVSLLQGNVDQEQKFDPAFRETTFRLYGDLVARSRGQLVVLPESAFPMFARQVPGEVVDELAAEGARRNGLVLVGLFTAEPPLPGTRSARFYNTVAALGAEAPTLYRKRHLVPFGESIPFSAWLGPLLDRVLAIPLADQTPGPAEQRPFEVAGHRIAVNICYEDAFGSELAHAARDADILVNVTNDAWYGHSVAAWQHNQIASMRALELGRPMLRATNTGITSAIGPDGRVRSALPWFTRGVLEITLQGRAGTTPFARWRDALAVGACIVLAAAAFAHATQRARRRAVAA